MFAHRVGEAEKAVPGSYQGQLDKRLRSLYVLLRPGLDEEKNISKSRQTYRVRLLGPASMSSPPLPEPVAALPGAMVSVENHQRVDLIKPKQLWD